MRKLLLVLTLAFSGAATAQSSTSTGTCDFLQVSYSATDGVTKPTVSNAVSDLPNAAVSFAAFSGGCLLIEFSASVTARAAGSFYVRPVIDQDSSITTVPLMISVSASTDPRQVHPMFVLSVEQGITAGNHSVKIQMKASRSNVLHASGMIVAVHHN
jgi:hypothetical protein